MPYNFATPDDIGDIRASELHTSLGESLSAQAGESFMSGVRTVARGLQAASAAGDLDSAVNTVPGMSVDDQATTQQQYLDLKDQIPDTPIADAKARVKQEGLDGQLTLPDQPTIKQPVLDLMIQHAHERADYNAAVSRGPQGFIPGALGAATSIGVGIIDPLNAAAFSIPVLGEARWGKMLLDAGDSIAARAGVRALQGAAQGAVGTAALQPADWWLHTQDGQDYTMADALKSIVMGAGMGAVAHAGFGAAGDVNARLKSVPLPGSPEDLVNRGLMSGRVLPETAFDGQGVGLDDVPGISPETPPAATAAHPAAVLADLPPAVREDVTRAAIADVIADRPGRAGEMLQEAAKDDPRIAETVNPYFEAYHGSPHDFDAFDLSQVGNGEGAQSYGHGLYFAENRDVAEGYRSRLSGGQVISNDALAHYFAPGDVVEGYGGSRDRVLAFDRDSGIVTVQGVDANGDVKPGMEGRVRQHQTMPSLSQVNAVLKAKGLPEQTTGALYKVRISADRDHFLDWDKPLSEQSEFVQKALREHPDAMIAGTAEKWGHDVPSMYSRIGQRLDGEEGSAKASEALREAGIPGIKYLDAGSRDVGDGTRNYVVFDDKHLEITDKNGKSVAPPRASAAAAKAGADVLPGPPAARGPRAKDPAHYSLIEFLASAGGLRNDDALIGDVHSSLGGKNKLVPGFGSLLRKPRELSEAASRGGGRAPMSLDQAREAAVDAGYLHDDGRLGRGESTSTVNDLLDAIDREVRGNKVYRNDEAPPASKAQMAADRDENLQMLDRHFSDALDESGIDRASIPDKTWNRVLEIMDREHVEDPIVAYEQAVMEETHYAEQVGQGGRTEEFIPGWDVRDDAGAAPGRGGPTAPVGPDGTRAAARQPGDANQRANWNALADARPGYDDPDVIAESKAAASTPEPASIETFNSDGEPERPATKAQRALEQATKDAEQLLDDMLPRLSDEERQAFTDALNQLDQDKAAREQIVRDGAACLAEAVV